MDSYKHPLVRDVMSTSLPMKVKLLQFQEVIKALLARFGEIGITPSPLENASYCTRIAWLMEVTSGLLTNIYDGVGPEGEEREHFVEVLLSNKQYLEDMQEIFKQHEQPLFYASSLN